MFCMVLKNTHEITLDNIIQHTQSVKKGIKKSLLVVDMPKGTYKNKSNLAKKMQNYYEKRLNVMLLKLESNKKNFNIIKAFVKLKIPVMGHIGYTPQFKKKFKIEGRTRIKAKKLT